MHKITLIGNLTNDPTMRTVNVNGMQSSVCSFSVAVNERSGQNERTYYYNVSVWRNSAESCHRYLTKGRKVYVEGTPRLNTYTANDGSTRASIEVTASYVEFLSSRNDDGQGNPQAAQPRQAQPAVAPNYDAPAVDPNAGFSAATNDELPF